MRRSVAFFVSVTASIPLVAPAALFLACDPDLNALKTPPAEAGPAPTTSKPGDAAAPPGSDASGDASTDAPATTDAQTDSGPSGHVMDGTNDFSAGETFPTTSSSTGYTSYVAWDADSLYFGLTGDDIGRPASDQKWVLLYLGTGGGGSTQGINYNGGGAALSQQPTLPFSALYHVRLKTDLSYVNGQTWSGSAWTDAAGLVPDCVKQGTFVECRVARTSLGSPSKLDLVMTMVIEHQGAEWTYAAIPQGTITDGKDPDYAKYFEFDLGNTTTAPNTYPPKP